MFRRKRARASVWVCHGCGRNERITKTTITPTRCPRCSTWLAVAPQVDTVRGPYETRDGAA